MTGSSNQALSSGDIFFVCANSLNNAATCLEERSSAFSAAKVFGATRTAAEPKPTLKKILRFI